MKNVYRATDEELTTIKYTAKVDLPAAFNRLDRCNVSIKATGKRSSVDMADVLRVFDSVGPEAEPLHLTVVIYAQADHLKAVQSIVQVNLTSSRDILFGRTTREQLEELVAAVRAVPQGRSPTPDEHEAMYGVRDRVQDDEAALHLNIKCNSTQSRVQCSFNHFDRFIENNPDRVVCKSDGCEFRGGCITSSIESGRRTFKK